MAPKARKAFSYPASAPKARSELKRRGKNNIKAGQIRSKS